MQNPMTNVYSDICCTSTVPLELADYGNYQRNSQTSELKKKFQENKNQQGSALSEEKNSNVLSIRVPTITENIVPSKRRVKKHLSWKYSQPISTLRERNRYAR